jgi:hypothetical protein
MEGQGASSAALATAAELPDESEAVGDGELPADVLVLVLLPLKGDMSSLCASACVARAWRKAASSPRLWMNLGPFLGNAAANLTDARLALLVSRARRHLLHLNLQGISKSGLTDEGVAEALRREKHIQIFAANGVPLTGAGIAAALAPSRGRLRTLYVNGVRALPKPVSAGRLSSDQLNTLLADCNKKMGELRALLAPGASLNATTVCKVMLEGHVYCTRMGKNEDTCRCGATHCKFHAKSMFTCEECFQPTCERCSSYGGLICEDCASNVDGSNFGSDFDGEF